MCTWCAGLRRICASNSRSASLSQHIIQPFCSFPGRNDAFGEFFSRGQPWHCFCRFEGDHGTVPSIDQCKVRYLPLVLFAVSGFVLCTEVVAQPFDLDPTRWYPLEANNYWHYRTRDGFSDYVVKSTGDTLVNDVSWTAFIEVLCGGPYCPSPPEWQRLTEGYYVLLTRNFTRIDTLWKTTPRSLLPSTCLTTDIEQVCYTFAYEI